MNSRKIKIHEVRKTTEDMKGKFNKDAESLKIST
jgi:hypothetical protein